MENEETELVENETRYEAFLQLKSRCDEAGIKYKQFIAEDDGEAFFKVYLPAGRDERLLLLRESAKHRIRNLLSCSFEKYVFLGDYQAVASYELGSIEALISSLHPFPTLYINRQLRRVFSGEWNEEDEETSDGEILLTAETKTGEPNIKLSLSNNSLPLLEVVSRAHGRLKNLSIKIENLSISRHDEALGILERISGALFFQIDMFTNLPFALIRERRPRILHLIRKSSDQTSIVGLKFPEYQYDKEPLSLYWYAKSATQMPLLQFLAYYQAIEFYFPVYSQMEAKRRVSRVLKDPTFDKSRDTDIIRLISSITQGSRSGFGDERSQLKATINECISEQELRDFIETKPHLKKFYSSNDKKISSCIIPVKRPSEDLRSKVGERIYDIRCKIVHTKTGENTENVELLLPFSKEAEMLNYDIELLKFITRQVIIGSSRPMTV
jgi:hypothetical protein